jgi:hypothetical protein
LARERVVRDAVRAAWVTFAARFSDDAPTVNELVLHKRYPALEAWPADAEFGLVVLGWMLGAGFSLPEFSKAVNRLVPKFTRAASAIPIGGDLTYVTIGDASRAAFRNAGVVCDYGLNGEILYWPLELRG